MSSSIWNFDTRATDGADRSTAFYQKDAQGLDVGQVLAATRNELPLMDRNKLVHDAFLGSGTSFDVNRELFYHASYMEGVLPPYYVAVKYVKLTADSPESNRWRLRTVMREIRVMMHPSLRNLKCIVPLLGYGWKNDPVLASVPYIVADYSSQGTLRTFLTNIEQTAGERQDFAVDIALGVAALHANGIVHGDIKLENVLVYGSSGPNLHEHDPDYIRQWERNQIAKLADFGSVIFANDSSPLQYAGTSIYNAPELQHWAPHEEPNEDRSTFSACKKADVYSFGLMVWEVMNKGKIYHSAMPNYDGNQDIIDFLRDMFLERADRALQLAQNWVSTYSCLHPEETWNFTIKNAVRKTFGCCLKDVAVDRADMEVVVAALASGTSTKRQPPTYPLPTETAVVQVRTERPAAPYGYYVRSQAPNIAIPIPSRTKSPFLRRFSSLSNEWKLTTETEDDNFNQTYTVDAIYAPASVRRVWVNPQAYDLFEVTAANSPPWDVQCQAVDRLRQDVMRESDEEKKARAHLQLSLCYHIGFGTEPDTEKTMLHMGEAANNGNRIASTIRQAIQAALHTATYGTEGIHDNAVTFIERFRACCSEDELLSSHDIEQHPTTTHLVRPLVSACKAGLFETALNLAKRCSRASIDWSVVWPNPMHWLVMFKLEDARLIMEELLMANPTATFEQSSQDTIYVPELALELFGSPLMWAARVGLTELASLLIDRGASIDCRWRRDLRQEDGVRQSDSLHYSATDLAAIWHHADMLRMLTKRGATLYGGGEHENHSASCLAGSPVRPLARQAMHGASTLKAFRDTLALLSELEQARESERTAWQDKAFEIAFTHCDQDPYILEGLQELRQSKSLSDRFLFFAVKDAPIRRCSLARLNMALPIVEDINAVDTDGKTVLQYAAESGSSVIVRRLLDDPRIDINSRRSNLPRPIALAAQTGAEGIVDLLVEAVADLDVEDRPARTPLQYALESRQALMAARLINAGARLRFAIPVTRDGVEASYTTPLFLATGDQDQAESILSPLIEACQKLRETNILDFHNPRDWTALHKAAWYGDYEGVRALLRAGADPNIRSTLGLPRKRRTGTALEMTVRLSDDLNGLGNQGWKQSSITWLAKGGIIAWKSYLGRLENIIGVLQGARNATLS